MAYPLSRSAPGILSLVVLLLPPAIFAQEFDDDARPGDARPFVADDLADDPPVVEEPQRLLTAPEFFDRVAEKYGRIVDYVAQVRITNNDETQSGTYSFAEPNYMRIDYEIPSGQVLVSDGVELQVYVPRYNVVLHQTLRSGSAGGVASLAGDLGLSLLRQHYAVSYTIGPDPTPLDDGSDEAVVKLTLVWRNPGDVGYREIGLAVDEDYIIRRIVGTTIDFREVAIDFIDVETNTGLPIAMFDYDPPASANVDRNFMYEGPR